MAPVGNAAAEQDYQHLCASRVRRVYISGAALLFAAVVHALLLAAFIANLNSPAAAFPEAARFGGAFLSALPITYFLARTYTDCRADARQARAWLAEFRALHGKTQWPGER
jgi:hypothetical protein